MTSNSVRWSPAPLHFKMCLYVAARTREWAGMPSPVVHYLLCFPVLATPLPKLLFKEEANPGSAPGTPGVSPCSGIGVVCNSTIILKTNDYIPVETRAGDESRDFINHLFLYLSLHLPLFLSHSTGVWSDPYFHAQHSSMVSLARITMQPGKCRYFPKLTAFCTWG